MSWRALQPALRTVADYEQCARDAHELVRHVRIRAAATDARIPPGEVRVIVRGRFRRRLPDDVVRCVHRAVAERNQVNVRLSVTS